MKHPAFQALARTANRVFRERGQHFWYRFDSEIPLPITLIFNDAYAEVDAAGVRVEEPQPNAFILISESIKLAPDRAGQSLDMMFNNRDILEINNVKYAIESCKADGYSQLQVKLIRKSNSV